MAGYQSARDAYEKAVQEGPDLRVTGARHSLIAAMEELDRAWAWGATSDIWIPALDAFPGADATPLVIAVTNVEGDQVAAPPETQGPATSKTIDVLRALRYIRVIVRSLDRTATINLTTGAVENRATVVKPARS